MILSRRAIFAALLIAFDACAALDDVNAGTEPGSFNPDSTRSTTVVLAATPSSTDLAASSDPPWNPPRAMASRRGWEQVLLFPGFVVSQPLYWLGNGADRAFLYVEQTAFIQKVSAVAKSYQMATGISVAAAKLGDRTGLGGRVEARSPLLGGALRNLITVAHSASTKHYHLTEVKALGNPLGFEYYYAWRPRDRFYGLGMGTLEDSLSDYATQSDGVKFSISHAWNQEDEPGGKLRTFVGAWFGPRTMITRHGRDPGTPSFNEEFPGFAAQTLDRRFEHLTYGGRLASDWRVGVPHWAEGWRALIQVERFDKPIEFLALRNGRGGGAQFTRTTAEFETGRSFFRDPRTLRIMGRLVDTGVSSGGERFLIEDMPSLGGSRGLYGFEPGRFHDLDAVLLRVTYVFPLQRRFEIDLHAETGGVFGDVWNQTRIDRMEQSYGAAFRVRAANHPAGMVGVDFSKEALRIRYTLGNPE